MIDDPSSIVTPLPPPTRVPIPITICAYPLSDGYMLVAANGDRRIAEVALTGAASMLIDDATGLLGRLIAAELAKFLRTVIR